MTKDRTSTDGENSESAGISRPTPPFVRLRGSHSSNLEIVAMRRPRNDDDDPVPDDDPPPPPPDPPPPGISTPDLAIQVLTCLDPQLNDRIVSSVRQAIAANADVRTACINQKQCIGVWLRPAVNRRDSQARDNGLAALNLLRPGETVVFFINASLVRRMAFEAWDKQPKRVDGDGNQDPNGPVHLTGFSVSLESPNRVVTRIDGFDERPWPDVSFQLSITDTLQATDDGLDCQSERDLDVDTSWLNFLTVVFTLALPPLGLVFLIERIIVGMKDAPHGDAGVGCAALGMIPKKILIPGGQKVVATYDRVDVSNGGIFAGGFVEVLPRSPEVFINGATNISVAEGSLTASANYTLHTDDLRPPFESAGVVKALARVGTDGTTPFTTRPRIEWSGDGVPLRPKAETTSFQFDTSGAQAGTVLMKRVAVLVVDSDGLRASAEILVRIHVIPPQNEDDDFPLVCRTKPWLPQCQEPMLRAASSRRTKQPADMKAGKI